MTGEPRFIDPADWTEQPWRNGGGVTQEIMARHDAGGLIWRVSTAIVEADGPYSAFPGLTRLSTVIAGHGTVLTDREGGGTVAIPLLGLAKLDGDRIYDGRLVDGPVRHLNIFFDPARIEASVEMCPEQETARGCPGLSLVIQDRVQGDAGHYWTVLNTDSPDTVDRITVSFHGR